VSAPVRRRQVVYATTRGVSVRRACALFQVARSSRQYQSRLPAKDAPVLARLQALAAQYPRYGYRFMQIFLAREGFRLGLDRTYRLWRTAGLQVPRKRRRRRVAAPRPRPTPPVAANQVWAIDFLFDACANGQVLKCLTIVDEWTRECLAIDVAGRIRSARVIDLLSRLVSVHGVPRYVRADNGPEFVSRAIMRWLLASGIDTAFIDPGKPWQNGTNESFNGTFRDECLNVEWFRTRAEATVVIEQWRRHYNEVRPHSSLAYQTPEEFKSQIKSGHLEERPSTQSLILQ
jgi:putative transposase